MANKQSIVLKMILSMIYTIVIVTSTSISSDLPNIIFMFADDMGFNDVQFTSSDLTQPSTDTNTPNLNKLARVEGIVLHNYYVHRMCSPTRAAFLSGRYSFRSGMATNLLQPDMAVSLTRQVSLLSEEFKLAGYNTHAIGKWHLGYQAWEYTPTYRGFDTFYGYYNAWTDYYLSDYYIIVDDVEKNYLDLRQNEDVMSTDNIYSIDRFRDEAIGILSNNENAPFFMYIAWQSSHLPSEAPDAYFDLYKESTTDQGVALDEARIYNQAQTSCMDAAIGQIVAALKANSLWSNTLLIFSSDNGGLINVGDNFPLRGYKKTVFEGGLRVPAFVSGGYLSAEQRGKVTGGNEYFHVTDWYPTLLEAAGIEVQYAKSSKKKVENEVVGWEASDYVIPLDGISIWNRIQHGTMDQALSSRVMYLDVVVDADLNCLNGSVRSGKWKYIKGLGTTDSADTDDGYLWGDSFADVSSDRHLWGRHFANGEIENSLGCDLDPNAEPANLLCFETVEGCLFDLEADPCEMNDVSVEFPVKFDDLRQKLQDLAKSIPTDVTSDGLFGMDSTDEWCPSSSGEYWGPWQEYALTGFEQVLLTDFNALYADGQLMGNNEKTKELTKMHPRVTVSSSCNDKDEGLYYIKPTVHGAIIPVICNGGFTMLDASLNFDALSTYFTSMYRYGDGAKAIYGTDCSDSAGWRDWYIPANANTKFRVARDCLECEQGGIYGDNTGYYMSNGYFCPVMLDIDGCSDKKDLSGQVVPDVMCNICDDVDGLCGDGEGRTGETLFDSADPSWCDCYTLQLSADHLTTTEHGAYCQDTLDWRPNLVVDRSQCTCYKPLDVELQIYDDIEMSQLPFVSAAFKDDIIASGLYIDDMIIWDEEEEDDDSISDKTTCGETTTYLSQDDFLYGTYRITDCGNYVLTQDIVVNFNKPSRKFDFFAGDSPNSYNMENLPWFPSTAQQESGQYFGFNAFWGPYSIGFMAAITVETDHVYIDLNGFSISMDYEFYLQQRFFALIEFGNKQFEARQGPVDFGRDDLCAKDIIVKDGTLGLSSHHGIHGSCVKGAVISNVNIANFDVTGIQCNGCRAMTIESCEIGPQNVNIPVRGRYTHARIMLSRLRYLVDEYGAETLSFANRNGAVITVQELADTLIEQMDMVYYHIIDGIEFAEDNSQWMTAKETFINPSGWMDGGSSYGILLNGFGTAVVNIGRRTGSTFDINIADVEIHDIRVKPYENFWAAAGSHIVHGFFFETIDWNGNVMDDSGLYLGDTYTDILFAANKYLSHEFCPLGPLFYLDALADWVWIDGTSTNELDLDFRCGSDIQSHVSKGAMGIRIDGVQDYSLQNVYIHDIANWGDLGSSACGEYEGITFEIGVDVDKDIQYGYTGSKVHGILTDYATGTLKNIKIEHLKSLYGSANAIALYKGSAATLDGYININDIIAGSSLSADEAKQLILPNPQPFVCSILIGANSDSETNPELTPSVSINGDFIVSATNLFGYDYCLENERVGTMADVKTPQYFGETNVVNGDLVFSAKKINFKNTFILGLLSIFVVAAILFFKIDKKKLNELQKSKFTTYGSVITN